MNQRIRTVYLIAAATLLAILICVPAVLAQTGSQDEIVPSFDRFPAKLPGTMTAGGSGDPYAVQASGAESLGLATDVSPSSIAPLELTIVRGDLQDGVPGINSTRRISIPYGFRTPLPIESGGLDVVAFGHGGCTAGEEATVAVTITQAMSTALATGETTHTCTGELQMWSLTAHATTPTTFVAGPARACGLATTRAGAYVTDTFAWCKDVDLAAFDHRAYLPLILGP